MDFGSEIRTVFPSAEIRESITSAKPGWTSFNSSIAFSPEEGWKLLLRSSNYVMDIFGRYQTNDPGTVIRTVNYLCDLDADLNVVGIAPLDDSEVSVGEFPLVRGMEDARLYWNYTDHHWHTYGTLREHQQSGVCSIAEDKLIGTKVVSRHVYAGPDPGRHEKNWMHLEYQPTFIYTCYPAVVFDSEDEVLLTRSDFTNPVVGLANLRGSSPAIWVQKLASYLAVTHEVYWEDTRRYYFHRLVKFSGSGRAQSLSPPFYLVSQGIQFCAGLAPYGDDRVVMSLGIGDTRSVLAVVEVNEIEEAMSDAEAKFTVGETQQQPEEGSPADG